MKVLLTGASGFVGSHVLDSLCEHKIETAILLRDSSSRRFINTSISTVELRAGSIDDPVSLAKAVRGVSHVIHCAGCTKALNVSEFYQTNHQGTVNLVHAVNAENPSIIRFLHISSLAVSGPATANHPAQEDQPPHPVSEYGKSKLAAESAIRDQCKSPFTILRPSAVYGPRDTGFLSMFKAVKNHLLPRPNKSQALSLVYVKDLAEVVVSCLFDAKTAGETYFVASQEIVTGRAMAEEIAARMGHWTIPIPVPEFALLGLCLMQQGLSQLTRRAHLLNLQKFAELRAPGWVCNPAKLLRAGLCCQTNLRQGVAQTLKWYTREHWL